MSSPQSAYQAASTFGKMGKKYELAFDRVPAQVRSLDWLLSKLPPHATALDVGCGTGQPACGMLAAAGHTVHGVDITPAMIDVARSQIAGAIFEISDSRAWTPDAAHLRGYDAIVSCFAFLNGVSQDDIRAFFHRAFSWLKPGGHFLFGTVPLDVNNTTITCLGQEIEVSSLSVEETLAAIKKAGFVVDQTEMEGYMPRAVEAGICKAEDIWEEEHMFVLCRKPEQ